LYFAHGPQISGDGPARQPRNSFTASLGVDLPRPSLPVGRPTCRPRSHTLDLRPARTHAPECRGRGGPGATWSSNPSGGNGGATPPPRALPHGHSALNRNTNSGGHGHPHCTGAQVVGQARGPAGRATRRSNSNRRDAHALHQRMEGRPVPSSRPLRAVAGRWPATPT
jgi:hypothetical protein